MTSEVAHRRPQREFWSYPTATRRFHDGAGDNVEVVQDAHAVHEQRVFVLRLLSETNISENSDEA